MKEVYTPEMIAKRKAALKLEIEEVENKLGENLELGKKQLEEELIKKLLMPVSAAKLADIGFNLAANVITTKVEDMLTTDDEDSAFKQGMAPVVKALLPEILEALLLKLRRHNLAQHIDEESE